MAARRVHLKAAMLVERMAESRAEMLDGSMAE
jgi:hypothetical protein